MRIEGNPSGAGALGNSKFISFRKDAVKVLQ